jgi:hypothetical protein
MSSEDDAPSQVAGKDKGVAEERGKDEATLLQGTTLRVYRFLFKQGKPVRIHDIQKGLDLSSPSVAQYQIAKLLRAGLIRETEEGYVVDRVVLGNLLRVGSTVLPYQVTYTVFFAAALAVLLSVLRPAGPPTSTYIFSVIVVWIGFAISFFESWKMIRGI